MSYQKKLSCDEQKTAESKTKCRIFCVLFVGRGNNCIYIRLLMNKQRLVLATDSGKTRRKVIYFVTYACILSFRVSLPYPVYILTGKTEKQDRNRIGPSITGQKVINLIIIVCIFVLRFGNVILGVRMREGERTITFEKVFLVMFSVMFLSPILKDLCKDYCKKHMYQIYGQC